MKTKTVKSHYSIPKTTSVDFFDIPIDSDVKAFICPFLIANNRDKKLADAVYKQLNAFLTKLNKDFIMPNDRPNGLNFLSHLHEPNEYHFGYSDANKGKGISKSRAEDIFTALRNNRFARGGVSITNEAHNVLLLVKGIGQDIMSDFAANVCRHIFAVFTETQCKKHGIPTIPTQIEYFDAPTGSWKTAKVNLPSYLGKKLIFVPSWLVAGNRAYHSLYNHFIASHYIAIELLAEKKKAPAGSKVIIELKNGTKKAIIKEIVRVYGKAKGDLIDFVLSYQGSLQQFLDYAKEHYPELDLSDL